MNTSTIASFVPKLWENTITSQYKKLLIYGNLVNNKYEGLISQKGDTVKINFLGKITVKKYTDGEDIGRPEDLSTNEIELKIDQADYFNFRITDIAKVQAAGNLRKEAMIDASYRLSEQIENYIASLMKEGQLKLGDDANPVTLDKNNIYEQIIEMKVLLDKNNVPADGRFLVIPPEAEALLLSDTRFASAYGVNAEQRLIKGYVAKVVGFDIYVSNNVPNENNKNFKIIASTEDSTTFAQQILKIEGYRPESGFEDAIKGLQVYGAKVTRPEAIAVMTANFSGAITNKGKAAK